MDLGDWEANALHVALATSMPLPVGGLTADLTRVTGISVRDK